MKTIQISLLFLFIASLHLTGQKYSKQFGVIGREELELEQYLKDPEAEALVLYDVGKSHFVRKENTYHVIFERTTRVKILAESGIKWSEVEIPFYKEGNISEQVYDIEATTYNYDNGSIQTTWLDPANTFEEQLNDYWKLKKFAIPNVKVGSIVEYRYKIESSYKFNLRDWEFQWQIPVLYSEYQVNMIPFYEYSYLLQGKAGFDHQESYVQKGTERQFGSIQFKDMIHKYIMVDVPAFRDEEFISSINDYIIKLDFQLAKVNSTTGTTAEIQTTWEDMVRSRIKHKDFGGHLAKSEKLAAKLEGLKLNANQSEEERFNAVMDYLKSYYSWNKYRDTYASKAPKDLINDKYGNCADLNLFAVGALRSAGIEAYPVLISTRDHGKIKYDYPYSHFFNYLIILAKVDGQVILSDATDPFCMNDRIPEGCINDKGLIVKKEEVQWVGLECTRPSERNTHFNVKFSENQLIVDLTQRSTEYDAISYRKNYKDENETVVRQINSNGYKVNNESIAIQNIDKKDQPFILEYQFAEEPEVINDKIYLSPFFAEVIAESPLKQKTRTYPVDLTYPRKRSLTSTIEVPEGYEIDYTPENGRINNQEFEMEYSVLKGENAVTVSMSYYFKKSVYAVSSYNKIRYYFNEISKKGNEKIVFSKSVISSP